MGRDESQADVSSVMYPPLVMGAQTEFMLAAIARMPSFWQVLSSCNAGR